MAQEQLRFSVRCDEFAPGRVREFLCGLSGTGWVVGDAMLVASELVTNAVQHSWCSEDDLLSVCVQHNGRLRIAIVDPGLSGRNANIAHRPPELGGLGLKVVERLASRWGAERVAGGYKVWAELETAAPQPAMDA